jgi:tRNA(fMet)-specific endonuclease VapC
MEALIFDTTFLIDFQRERTSEKVGAAHRFLLEYQEAAALLPVIAYGEFCEGFESSDDVCFLSFVESFEVLPITPLVASIYATEVRRLRRRGQLIGSNDLWIAATALEKGLPLVTRNMGDFARIHDLRLLGY